MQRRFLSGLVLTLVLNVLIKPISIFGIDAAVQNRVGTENYGIYFSLLGFSFLFNIFLDLGINNFTTKSMAQHANAASSYLGKVVLFRIVLFVFYAVFSFSIALILGWKSYELYLLSFLVINQFLVTLIAYTRSHFSGLLMFKADAFISVLDRVLLILFCGILLYTPITGYHFEIEWFVWLQTACYGITLIVAFGILIGKIGTPRVSLNPLFSYAIVRKSFPYALLILLMMIYTRVDSVMIERLHAFGKEEAGYYAQGFRLFDALFMFAMIFSNLLFPIFSRMLSKGENIRPVLSASFKLLMGGTIAFIVFAVFNAETLLGWIYKEDVQTSATSFQLLMFGSLGMCATLIFGTLLTANGSLHFLNITSALGIVLNIIINSLLIPEYGANGAAFATLITQSLVALAQVIFCLYKFPITPSWKKALLFLAFVACIVSLNYFISPIGPLQLLVVGSVSGTTLVLFRLVNIPELKQIFSKPEKEIKAI